MCDLSSQSGQSLIEVMVAITLLTVGFLGITSLLSRSLALNRVTTNQLTATYLASEGVEIAKNLIDHDVYAGGDGQWGACFSGKGGTDFELDYTTIDCGTLTQFSKTPLYYHPDTHFYNYNSNGGTATDFTRDVRVQMSGDEAIVNTIVSWSGLGGSPGSINLEDHFYKWH